MVETAYAWRCHACYAANPAAAASCSSCGCPGRATAREIEFFRSKVAPDVLQQDQLDLAHQTKLVDEAVATSRYRFWYRASLCAFLLSLLIPNTIGLRMLALGWLALKYSLAWLANPLLIIAFISARPSGNPGSHRWLAYCSLGLMFMAPGEAIAKVSPFPFLIWVASGVMLIIGMEQYRRLSKFAGRRVGSA